VLARYVGMATDGGVTQAMFPEGGLSLDGALQPPKLGLLTYLVEERSDPNRDVVFVPVAINYDRVFEDRLLIAAGQAGRRRFPARISVVARFVLRQIWLRLRGRYHRHGYAAVSFGAPISLAQFQRDMPEANVSHLAQVLMQRIAQVIPVLPVPLVARALTMAGGSLDRETLDRAVGGMLEAVPKAHVHLPRNDPAYAVRFGLRALQERGMIDDRAGILSVVEKDRPLLDYYAASIAHLFCDRSDGR
jgi:glycerol-3-phosphate O-acyltransferase